MNDNILIFDFDGTIADTHRYIIEISNSLAAEFKYKLIEPEDIENLKAMTSQQVIQRLHVPIMKIPAILTRAKQEFQKGVMNLLPIPGLQEALAQLKDNGARMGILSSNSRDNILRFLDNHGLNIFDFIHSTPKVWSKNTSLKKLMQEHGLAAGQILYIGDEIRDITAARKSGVKVAAVTWGYNSSQALAEHAPDLLLHYPGDLTALWAGDTAFPSACAGPAATDDQGPQSFTPA